MGAFGAIDKDGSLASRRELQATFGKGGGKGRAGITGSPCGESFLANAIDRDGGAFGLGAFPRCLLRDRTTSGKEPSGFHCGGDVAAAVLQKSFMDGAVMLAPHERKAAFVFDDAADFFPTRVFVAEVCHPPVRPNQGIDQMVMEAIIFGVLNAASRHVFEAKFGLVMRHEDLHDGVGVAAERWIDMKMVNGTIRSAVGSRQDEFPDLIGKGGGAEVAGVEDVNLLSPFPGK